MAQDNTRIQMLALVLLGAFAFLCIDLSSVRSAMADYLPLHGIEAETAEAPEAPRLQTVGRPALADAPAEAPALELPCWAVPPASETVRVEQLAASMGTVALPDPRTNAPLITSMWMTPTTGWVSLDAAAADLQLTDDQRVSWERTIEDARRDLSDLRHVRNERGVSWHDVFSVTATDVNPDDAKAAILLARQAAVFMSTELRGGETYQAAETRIVSGHRDLLRADLTPEQWPRFDVGDVSRLLGASRPGAAKRLVLRGAGGRRVILRVGTPLRRRA